VVGAVLRAAGKQQTDAEYFLAGRALRWPFIGMSLLASNISAEHVVGLAGDGYRVGVVTGGFEWMAASAFHKYRGKQPDPGCLPLDARRHSPARGTP